MAETKEATQKTADKKPAEKKSTTPATGAKNVTLSFTTPEELKAHAAISAAAEADDRSINSYVVRVLMGKEPNPLTPKTALSYTPIHPDTIDNDR